MNNINGKNVLKFQIKRQFTDLFKDYLDFLEGLRKEQILSDDYHRKKRKEILDKGNNSIRDLSDLTDKI